MSGILNALLAQTTTSSSDPFFANVSLLLHMDGTNGSTSFPDNSSIGNTVTSNSSAAVSTSVFKYGTGAVSLNGTSQYLSMPSNTALQFTGGNFTTEAWIYLTGYAQNQPGAGYTSNIFGKDLNAPAAREFILSLIGTASSWTNINIVTFQGNSANTVNLNLNVAQSFSLNTWYHVAAVRSGNTFYLFVNGNQVGTTTNSGSVTGTSTQFCVGAGRFDASNPTYFPGYIDEVRITKGVARYTANFTPPTAAFPNS